MDPLARQIAALHADSRVRVWSLVTTVFGDAVRHRGGRIATGQLLELMQRIGIEDGAVRTALSRLARDGWIESERDGRRSRYRLTERAKRETDTASREIYRGPVPEPEQWSLVLTDSPPKDALGLGGEAYLAQGAVAGGIAVTGRLTSGRDLVAARVVSDAHRAALMALAADLGGHPAGGLRPLEAMAARVLLIHRWRRIALRFPDIPAGFLPLGLADPRAALAVVYPALFAASEPWLDAPEPSETPMRFQSAEP